MPGYKAKSTTVLLGEEAMTLDFVIDPEITTTKGSVQSGCEGGYYTKSRLNLVEFFPGAYWGVFVILLLIVLFLLFLLRRKVILNRSKQRLPVGPKRSIVV